MVVAPAHDSSAPSDGGWLARLARSVPDCAIKLQEQKSRTEGAISLISRAPPALGSWRRRRTIIQSGYDGKERDHEIASLINILFSSLCFLSLCTRPGRSEPERQMESS